MNEEKNNDLTASSDSNENIAESMDCVNKEQSSDETGFDDKTLNNKSEDINLTEGSKADKETENFGETKSNKEKIDSQDEEKKSSFYIFIRKVKLNILQISAPNCIMRAAAAYLFISAFFAVYHYFMTRDDHSYTAIVNWGEFREAASLPLILLLSIAAYIIFTGLKTVFKNTRLDSYLLISGLAVFSMATLWRTGNVYYVFITTLVSAVLGYLGWRYDKCHSSVKLPFKVAVILISLLGLGIAAFIAVFTLYRYESYSNSCYDLGIFTQMYHSMINDLSLVTTCEREKFLSHFAIHCSPIYYLLLPFYYFFPTPHTLLIAQAVLIAIGVIPLVGICRRNKFTNTVTLFFSITYLFCAELIGPCFYEFHENAFLPPLLMWLFYAIESNKKILLYIFAALALMVKEDAPIYIVCIGIYLLCRKDKIGMRKHGGIIAATGAVYFVTVTSLMAKFGEGVMTSRTYGNLMLDYDAGFGEIVKTVIMNPAYFLSQLIREDNLIFFLTVMVPLGMMPLFTRKFSRLLLFVPFLLMNLASGYVYARDIGFQYVFGTSTCLIYATIINCADLRPKKHRYIAAFTAMASVYMSVGMHSGKIWYQEIYSDNKEKYQKQDELLSSIPEDASVVCDTFYVPPLANRDEVYQLNDDQVFRPSFTDFVVVRLDNDFEYRQQEIDKLLAEGYKYYNGDEAIMAIYVSAEYKANHLDN